MQTAAFKAPEVDIGRSSKLVSAVLGRAVDLTHLAALQASLTTGIRDAWFGYALAPATGAANAVNVLVFRGIQYSHVGQEWSYLFQAGEVAGNHLLLDNYILAVAPTIQSPVEPNAPRSDPSSGIPG